MSTTHDVVPNQRKCYRLNTTLDIVFTVTYYLELRNAIAIYSIFHILPKNVKLVVWTLTNLFDKNLYQ